MHKVISAFIPNPTLYDKLWDPNSHENNVLKVFTGGLINYLSLYMLYQAIPSGVSPEKIKLLKLPPEEIEILRLSYKDAIPLNVTSKSNRDIGNKDNATQGRPSRMQIACITRFIGCTLIGSFMVCDGLQHLLLDKYIRPSHSCVKQ